jgi:hypothetical protein
MPFKCNHLKCGPALLALLDERWADFCPLCEMEKLYHDPKTPPKVKKRLQKDLDAYTVPQLKPSSTRLNVQVRPSTLLYGEKTA